MIALRPGMAHMPQSMHVTGDIVAGHMATTRPPGVLTGLRVSAGSTTTTGPAPVSARVSACSRLLADRLIVNPALFAARIAARLDRVAGL